MKGRKVFGDRYPNFWDRMYYPILTVFEGQVNEWVSRVMKKVAEVRGSGSGNEGKVEEVIEAELSKVNEKIQESRCTEVLLIKGEFVLGRNREYRIISVNEFLDEVQKLLQESIKAWNIGLGERNEVESVSESGRGKSKFVPLEEFISQPLPIIGSYDVDEWLFDEEQAVASIINRRYKPDDVIRLVWDRDIGKVEEKLKRAGSKYITIIEGSIIEEYLENKCRVEGIYDFLNGIVDEITDYALESAEDEIWED
jgi:hypothetical protein